MMRIGMTLAAVVLGGVVLSAGEARACEGHHAQAEAASRPSTAPSSEAKPADGAAVDKASPGEPHAAKCQCGSAADCTCKKGTCECAKCKKHHHEEQPPVEAEVRLTVEHTLAA